MNERYPQKRNSSYTISHAIFTHGKPVTMKEGIALHGYTGLHAKSSMQALYRDMVTAGYLVMTDGTYDVAEYLKKYFTYIVDDSDGEVKKVVAPRYHKQFTPMKVQPRDERLREISFITVAG